MKSVLVVGIGIILGSHAYADQPGAIGLYPESQSLGEKRPCLPLNQRIHFSGSQIPVDSMNNISAGRIPGSQNASGNLNISGDEKTNSGPNFVSFGKDGNIQLQVVTRSPDSFTATTADVAGTIDISSESQRKIAQALAQLNGSKNLCVSEIAVSGHLYTTGGIGFGGNVHLYMNEGDSGYSLSFY